jgi:hypothetical protein
LAAAVMKMGFRLGSGFIAIFGMFLSHFHCVCGVSVHHGHRGPWDHYYITQINLTNYNSSYEINTTLDSPMISMQQQKSRQLSFCVLDPVKIYWNTSIIHPTSIHLAFLIDNEWDGYSTSLPSLSSSSISSSLSPEGIDVMSQHRRSEIMNPIRCEINEEHCVPKILNVHLLQEKKLLIDFDQPTSQPDLLTTTKLNVCSSVTQFSLISAVGSFAHSSSSSWEFYWSLVEFHFT